MFFGVHIMCIASLLGIFSSSVASELKTAESKFRRNLNMEINELKEAVRELERKSASFEQRARRDDDEMQRVRRGASGQRETESCVPGSEGCSGPLRRPYYPGYCVNCPPGPPGPSGHPGPIGIPGRDGRDGRETSGCCCSENENDGNGDDGSTSSSSTGGVVYVRWGRDDCPRSSELVYSGIAGGAHYTHIGSGSNYLCMPEEPIYDNPQAGTGGQNRGYVYGAEYEVNTFPQWGELHDSNAPCAVCRVSSRASLIMVPARNVCPGSEWTKEYSGLLASAFYNHNGRTEFVCIDGDPEAIDRSSHNANGALFYPVEGRCGSGGSGLPCTPYIDGNELTCAVCTR